MATRTVITRSRRTETVEANHFQFTSDDIIGIGEGLEAPKALADYKNRAWNAYEKLLIPTIAEEAWRRTDLKGLNPGKYVLPEGIPASTGPLQDVPDILLQPITGSRHGGQIVLGPKGSTIELDPELANKGVVFTDLETAWQKHPQILERIMGRLIRPEEGKFAAIAGSFAKRGVLVYIPPGVHVEEPLHSILWGPGINLAYVSHVLVLLDRGASATYVHESASLTETHGQTMHAGIVEIALEAEATLRFVELQSWGEHVWNFTHERARVDKDANLDWIFGALGSHLTKNFSDLDLAGQGAVGRMSGFYFADGDQHLDLDTQQNHLAPNTSSDLLYKGALRDKSRSVWQGMIYVAPGAQKTDGYQANRNLILSNQARADSIPGLEILADDVRCTHGATVGKIDAEQVFYLRSRGILYPDAERLIVEGFFDPIMQRIPFEGVRTRFQQAIGEKLG